MTSVAWRNVATDGAATDSTLTRPNPARIPDEVWVRDWGAVGDGTTDDTAAIQAAITYAETFTSPPPVTFDPYRYLVTSTLTVTKNGMRLIGGGGQRYTTGGGAGAGFDFEGGTTLVTSAAITVLQLGTGTIGGGVTGIVQGGTLVERIGFEDIGPNGATFVLVQLMNHFTLRECSFARGAIGVRVEAGAGFEDASWGKIDHCIFTGNTAGVKLTATAAGVPNISITDCDFQVYAAQYGIWNDNAANFVRVYNTKMDLFGAGCVGVQWDGGYQSRLSIDIEMHDDCDATSIGINVLSARHGITIEAPHIINHTTTEVGTGIYIAGGDATANKTSGVQIIGGQIANCGIGVHHAQYAIANTIIGTYFWNTVSTVAIRYDSGANYNAVVAVHFPGGPGTYITDNGTSNLRWFPVNPGGWSSHAVMGDIYSKTADSATLGVNGRFSIVNARSLRTEHVGGATPTGGSSGDIKVGTGKIWVNDGGTWKSVAIA